MTAKDLPTDFNQRTDMPRDALPADHRAELARKFREAATALEADRQERFALLDVKFFLLAALNDADRALDYGKPGAGLDYLLRGANDG
jgi:hypothetical protein